MNSGRLSSCTSFFVPDARGPIYPMKNKGKYKDALHKFCKDVGVVKRKRDSDENAEVCTNARMYDYMCSGHYSVIEARTSTNTILLKLAENFLIKDDIS